MNKNREILVKSNITSIDDAYSFMSRNVDKLPFMMYAYYFLIPYKMLEKYYVDDATMITFEGVPNSEHCISIIQKMRERIYDNKGLMKMQDWETSKYIKESMDELEKEGVELYKTLMFIRYEIPVLSDVSITTHSICNIDVNKYDEVLEMVRNAGYKARDIYDIMALLYTISGREINVNIFERAMNVEIIVNNKYRKIYEIAETPIYKLIGTRIAGHEIREPNSNEIPKSLRKIDSVVKRMAIIDDGNGNKILSYGRAFVRI